MDDDLFLHPPDVDDGECLRCGRFAFACIERLCCTECEHPKPTTDPATPVLTGAAR